ncbi:LLM class flavin-dependent oxidoreductase [Amycolatopsis jejuensis]|uniref:LLM class flavin-dependent oxidoreductase n=1 Tax=Amycolatopsis jejuensis TaxID=330084 RepID=UPI00068FBD42|nr:LLM class flavin-dependent oxidoreductase [Amycolatopsis jejuensis]
MKVGIGVVAAVARHPAVTAMEIATLARCYPGRVVPGIGHGLAFWTDQMGLTAKSPLTALEERVTAVRELLAGATVDRTGAQFTFAGIALAHPPREEVPILTGVLGPKSLRLSGRVADGTVMSVLSGAKYLEWALGHIRTGMAEGGRSTHLTPTFALFNCAPAGARASVRTPLAHYLAAVGPHCPLLKPYGYQDALAELMPGGAEQIERDLPGEWVDELAVAGDPDQVTERIHALLEAGATSVVLSPADRTTAATALELAAKAFG